MSGRKAVALHADYPAGFLQKLVVYRTVRFMTLDTGSPIDKMVVYHRMFI
jgi:hypothetical protein